MNIWIDISNAPHVNFFKDFIKEWQINHNIIVTTRPLSNTIDLLETHNIQYIVIGSHYGKNKITKIIGFFKRCGKLYKFLKSRKINIAISQSSFYSPYVAYKLKIQCIYTNDNEHAKGNYIGFFLAKYILLPEALSNWAKYRFFKSKVIFYPGVKEGIYMKGISKKALPKKPYTIYFRTEPWHSQYHNYISDTFDKMLTNLARDNNIVILPRDKNQAEYFKILSNNNNIKIASNVETVDVHLNNCDIFLGAGGSMTREFALVGIPTISLYRGSQLEVDKYLIDNGILIHESNLNIIDSNYISSLVKDSTTRSKSLDRMHKKGTQAKNIINNLIKNLAAQFD